MLRVDLNVKFHVKWWCHSRSLCAVHGQDQSNGQAHGGHDKPLWDGGSTTGSTDVWQRWPGTHGEIWYAKLLGLVCSTLNRKRFHQQAGIVLMSLLISLLCMLMYLISYIAQEAPKITF